jgi:hypothetical protein
MPVNRAARMGNWPGSNRKHPGPCGRKSVVFTPSMLASVDIKLTQISQHRQSRTGLMPFVRKAIRAT